MNPLEFWNEQLLQGIRNDLMAPTQAAYDAAIINQAMYNAVNEATGQTLKSFEYSGGPAAGADAGAAAFYAGAKTALSLFTSAASQAQIGAAAAAYAAANGYANPPAGSAVAKGEALGLATAGVALGRSATDGSANMMSIDTGGTGIGQWRPTPPDFHSGVTPDWGSVKPFVMNAGNEFRAPPPPAVGSAAYLDALLQVQCMGGTSAPLDSVCGAYAETAAQRAANTATGLFWSNDANGTYKPPGQWIQTAIGISTSLTTPLSLLQDARMFALVATAMGDASIAQWDTKYYYDVWRPVTAVNDPSNPNAPTTTWMPALNSGNSDQSLPVDHSTPAFPSYASGHSTFGAAATTALAGFFGTDSITFTVKSDSAPGETRTYNSLAAAAWENGISRIYGGWHYGFDNTAALAMGDQVGALVYANAFNVPEPTSLLLAGIGLLGLLATRRKPAA